MVKRWSGERNADASYTLGRIPERRSESGCFFRNDLRMKSNVWIRTDLKVPKVLKTSRTMSWSRISYFQNAFCRTSASEGHESG